jgi:hypothetical protein
MAERLRKFHQDEVRTKIQTSQLINRLTDHALNGPCLDASQVRAIEILMKKVLPDLQSIDLSATDGTLAEAAAYAWQPAQPKPQ